MNKFTYSLFPGDGDAYAFLVASDGWLGKKIRFFMWLKNKLLKKDTKNLVNHADLFINDTIIGAVKEGIVSTSLAGMYDDGVKRKIYIYKIMASTSIKEKRKLYNWAISKVGTPYEISNIFNHIYRILYIWLKGKEKWIGHTGNHSNSRYFCSEFVTKAINTTIPDFSLSAWDDDPMDLKELCDKKLIFIKTINF